MYLKNLLFVWATLWTLVACQKEEAQPTQPISSSQFCTSDNRFTNAEYFAEADIQSSIDLRYGNAIDWQGKATDLLLDVYFPDPAKDAMTTRPAVMVIHGGGFQSGSKEQLINECMEFAKRGFVVFTISYRLGWDSSQPTDQLRAIYRANQDARAALRYIVQNAANFGVDTDWIFVGGGSAGAITALNVVYADQNEWNALVPGIENTLGNLDTSSNELTNTFALKGIFNNWGAVLTTMMQPEEMLPMVAFHGELDTTVPIDEGVGGFGGSRIIYNTLTASGVCVDLTTQPDGLHGIYLGKDGAAFRVKRASCFFKSLMCNNCNSFSASERVEPNCTP